MSLYTEHVIKKTKTYLFHDKNYENLPVSFIVIVKMIIIQNYLAQCHKIYNIYIVYMGCRMHIYI